MSRLTAGYGSVALTTALLEVSLNETILAERNTLDCGKLPLREGRVEAKRTFDRRGRKEEQRMQQSGEDRRVGASGAP